MINFRIKPLLNTQDLLVQCSVLMHSNDKRLCPNVPESNKAAIRESMSKILPELAAPEFTMCRKGVDRVLATLEHTNQTKHIVSDLDDLRRRLLDQTESLFCLLLSENERNLYSPSGLLFGHLTETKFPTLSEDIAEAGKCLGLGRSTASVFHLMRVMELAVQKLGDELGVNLVGEKNWQCILDETNKKIQALDHKLARTKKLAEISSHLYAVKIAWRNEVMHPKQTYTLDEAHDVFRHAGTFIRELASVI